jgi:copper(I)-binding protein
MKFLYLFAVCMLLPLSATAQDILLFKNAFVAAGPPSESVAAYMTIENSGKKSRKIVGLSSRDFAEVQIHRSIIKDGIASMEAQSTLTIDAGGQVTLQPGGVHLMLSKPKYKLPADESIMLKIKEADGTEHNLALKVRAINQHDLHNH